jgi:hypothetical protein
VDPILLKAIDTLAPTWARAYPGAVTCASAFSFIKSTEAVQSQALVDGCGQAWDYSVHPLNPTWSRSALSCAPRINQTTRRSRNTLPYIFGDGDHDQAFFDVCRLTGHPGPDGRPDLNNTMILGACKDMIRLFSLIWFLSGHLRKITFQVLSATFSSHSDLTQGMLTAHGLRFFPGHDAKTRGRDCF